MTPLLLLVTICTLSLVSGGTLSGQGYSVEVISGNHAHNGQVVANGGYGPMGIIFQRDETLWFNNVYEGKMYHLSKTFQVLSVRDEGARGGTYMRGLAFSKTERLYVCYHNGTLIEWDIINNAPGRFVAAGNAFPTYRHSIDNITVPGCLGLACDPLSGDLFATDLGTARVWRIRNFESGTAVVEAYFVPPSGTAIFDGIAFTPAGTIYLAEVHETTGGPWNLTGTNKPMPPVGMRLATLTRIDGISVGVNLWDVEQPPYIVGSTNGGILGMVDLTREPHQVEHILTGGSRGDFSVVGYDGCIYATQTDSVVKIGREGGGCLDLYPTCPNLVPNVSFVNPNPENATLNAQFCTQLRLEDNPESLSWTCEITWGDSLTPEPCQFTANPQTITVCHTYTQPVIGYLPIVVTVADDQKFPTAVQKFVSIVSPTTTTTTTTSTTTSGSATSTNNPGSTSSTSANSGATSATSAATGAATSAASTSAGGTSATSAASTSAASTSAGGTSATSAATTGAGGSTATISVTGSNSMGVLESAGSTLSYGLSLLVAVFVARAIFTAFRA